jgi:uncharacterized damage-inducible protein DinB
MLDLLRPLFLHQEWADREFLRAAGACAGARDDRELRDALFHIVVVQRFFHSQFTETEFDMDQELRAPDSWDDLEALFQRTHQGQRKFLDSVSPAFLERILDLPHLEGVRPTVAQAMTQVVMHSQHHRGQCCTRLRKLGGSPPTIDYILWLRDGS